jgi:hypothetical protein
MAAPRIAHPPGTAGSPLPPACVRPVESGPPPVHQPHWTRSWTYSSRLKRSSFVDRGPPGSGAGGAGRGEASRPHRWRCPRLPRPPRNRPHSPRSQNRPAPRRSDPGKARSAARAGQSVISRCRESRLVSFRVPELLMPLKAIHGPDGRFSILFLNSFVNPGLSMSSQLLTLPSRPRVSTELSPLVNTSGGR